MPQAVYILFGFLFTIATMFSLGRLVVSRLHLALDDLEETLFSFMAGAVVLSLIVFLCCAAHVVYKPVFLGIGPVNPRSRA